LCEALNSYCELLYCGDNGLNLFVFFLVWAFVFVVPIPPLRSRWRLLPRLVTFLIGLLAFLILVTALTPLSLFVYWMVYLRLFFAFIEYVFKTVGRLARPAEGETREKTERPSFLYQPRLIRPKINFRVGGKIIALLFMLFLLFALVGGVFTQVQRISNAYYFNGFIQHASGMPFDRAIPDNQVRLVTEELAVSVARRHMAEFGSNMRVLDTHITKTLDGKLVWINVIGSTNTLAENYVKGFILIDATDPVAVPEIVHKEFMVGDGLWWDRNIVFRSYSAENTNSYGVAYPSWDPTTDDIVYIVARYEVGFDLIRRYKGIVIYNSEGNVIYDYTSLSSVPTWVNQVYDENWMENMINEWGGFRRGAGFDYWSGGFLWIVPPSRERVEMSEDTRYIVDPETEDVTAMVMVNPVANERTLAGVFKATRQGIFFYDYSAERFISGITAEDIVGGKIPPPATGYFETEMPLLYPVEVANGVFRLAWYVPIYWREGVGGPDETIILAGLAIIDALDINNVAINMAGGGLTSEQLVRETRLDFIRLFGAVTYVELRTTISDKQEYVSEGTTHVVLRTTNSSYPWIEATPNDLPTQQWYELLATQAGDDISANIEKREETWTITGFDNLDIP
jgi:hypothetical protein